MNTGYSEKAMRLREQAIAALLETTTITAAAKRTGVDESTLRAWLKDSAFAAEYRHARRAVMSKATDRLARACSNAVDNLIDVMAHSESDGSRITASKAVLDYAFKSVELDDLAARVVKLEEALNVTD
ncbi:MAG: hypothetical protein ACYDCO_18070 [Armatimonadota bacterium]